MRRVLLILTAAILLIGCDKETDLVIDYDIMQGTFLTVKDYTFTSQAGEPYILKAVEVGEDAVLIKYSARIGNITEIRLNYETSERQIMIQGYSAYFQIGRIEYSDDYNTISIFTEEQQMVAERTGQGSQ